MAGSLSLRPQLTCHLLSEPFLTTVLHVLPHQPVFSFHLTQTEIIYCKLLPCLLSVSSTPEHSSMRAETV